MKMSSTTVTPRIMGVSSLARRFSSMSSLVTMALEDVAVMPAMMSASRVPQPSANPNANPTPMLMSTYEPPEMMSLPALPKNSSWSNSSPRLNSRRIRPNTAMSSMSPEAKSSGNQSTFGLARRPTSM
ncbi:hypothetical protein CMMCAS03_14815 [Clavibacter michiganensis subsp. michiganensis]|nr:hypothetical protein DOU02_15290 [Clavibacter michiganensis subsp. michiganensis]OUD84748.1 hypothetical protein CMMCAS03_14815 [Clavibacter michiganensis subsp. michiganensis]OUD94005.1 hypothetical protein CMMCAS05_04850 [Clavibacter michiganensis subsp. michiganensis]